MGKQAQRRRVQRGTDRAPTDDRHDDFGRQNVKPDPEALLRKLLEAGKQDEDGRRPHDWVMNLVFALEEGEDEAQALAAERSAHEGVLNWEPTEGQDVLHVEGPYCANCHKIRGPLPVQTLCGEKRPNWLVKREVDDDLKFLPRGQRREVELRRRRQDAKLRKTLGEAYGPSGHQLAKAAHVNPKKDDPCMPHEVTFIDPEAAQPDAVLFEAA